MYSTIYGALRIFWPGGLAVRRKLRELERTQWFSREELEMWQLARIQKLLKYAYDCVPYYRNLYQRLDIHPEDIKTLQDFQSLPFLTKEDVNSNWDALISPELRSEAQTNFTGGSTGQPMRFAVEQSFHHWDAALEFRGRGWYGVREGDKIALVWGAQRDFHNWSWRARFKARILRERYLNAFSMTEAKMQAFAEMLVRWQPAMFRAYASAVSLFAEFIKEHGIEGIRPKLIELTAEKVTGPQRQLLEEVFRCKVADWYSAREMGTIAFQCEEGGQHVCETRYLEIVADGRVVEPGQLGEVVITSLHQYAMPFIRYKIGDLAIYESSGCTCGRGLPVLREVAGRTNDYLVAADGQFVHSEYFAYTFRARPEIARYQVYQPDRQHLEVRLACKRAVDQVWLENIRSQVQARFGAQTQVSVQVVDEIPLTSAGKHRFIISEVKPDFL
jgi:phenylacetate-CoA ligase